MQNFWRSESSDHRFIQEMVSRFISLSALLMALLNANEASSAEADQNSAEQLKALNDQTILNSRVWLDTEWDQFKHGAQEATWTLGGAWAWRVREGQDAIVRLTLPIVYDRSDAASGHAEKGGLGDIEIATGTAFRLTNTWRTGGGIELHCDTATNPALGDSVWRGVTSWSIAHDFTNWLTATFTAEYDHSFIEANNVSPQRYLELSLPTTVILPRDWSMSASYKLKINFENGNHCKHTFNGGVAKRLSKYPVALSFTMEKPLNGGNKRFQANFTITYYFQRYVR